MIKQQLFSLKKVELRDVWENEAGDFTPWLAEKENLKLLSESIGIVLELEAQEKDVGPFRADILCKDADNDSWVLIENQLEKTDHNHLGQLMTYAAGLEAVSIVWIAKNFTEEHRAALDWLNSITEEGINFFGLEVELWKIGDSHVAPKFNLISKPNDWTRTIKQAVSSRALTPHQELQISFWTSYKKYIGQKGDPVKSQPPWHQNWMNHPVGRSGARFSSVISTWNSVAGNSDPEIRTEFNLEGKNSSAVFAQLLEQKNDIENEIGRSLVWHNPDDTKSCKIYLPKDADFTDETQWPQQFQWLLDNILKFHHTFLPRIKNTSL